MISLTTSLHQFFLYYGKVGIYQENLESFLHISEELNMKGLNSGQKGVEGAGDDATPQKKNIPPNFLKASTTKKIMANFIQI